MYRIISCFVGVCFVAMLAASGVTAQGLVSGQAGFGNEWVRNHPFMIKGVISETPGASPGNSNPNQYWAAKHTVIVYRP